MAIPWLNAERQRRLTATQQNVVDQAVAVADYYRQGWGYPLCSVAVGLICNAYAESGLGRDNVGDSGLSFGPYQHYTSGGLGNVRLSQGWTRAHLDDPWWSAASIIAATLESAAGRTTLWEKSAADCAYAICIYAERPDNMYVKGRGRAADAKTWLPDPSWAALDGRALDAMIAAWLSPPQDVGPVLDIPANYVIRRF